MPITDAQLDYDDATHTYKLDGQQLISVTQVLKEAGLIDTSWYTREGADRGSYIAVATAIDDGGREGRVFDEDQLDPDMRGYVEAWRRFRTESGCEITAIEQHVYHPTLRYAGTLDRLVWWHYGAGLIDIKTGQPVPADAIQTAAYARSLPRRFYRRYGVYLRANGTYKLHEHDNFGDADVFLAALALVNWKRNHGIANADSNRSCEAA